jgi:membrane-bound lytic murein transglycosylase B
MIKYLAVFSIALTACASAPAAQDEVPTSSNTAPVATTTPSNAAQTAASAPAIMQLSQEDRFLAWKSGFIDQALTRNYDSELVKRVMGPAQINPSAIERDREQPEFTKPIWSYVENAASAGRLSTGREKLVLHKALFDEIEQRYNVDRGILTSIWGLESAFGKIQGDHDMIDSLSTLAFEGRRRAWAEQNLFAIFDMLARKDVRLDQLTGSWAGAMGMTQFIPTTFRDYAVDFDNNGNKDLWGHEGDALGSAAHYLSRHGWRIEEPVLAEVRLPLGFEYGLADGTKRTVSGWTGMGVGPISGQNWSKDAMFLEAKLLIPAGAKGPTFLTFKNFDVIKKYNNSTSYALGITVLAEGMQNRRAIQTSWPKLDKPLSRTDKEDMQRALTRQGFDTKGVDGQIGPNTRRAIRAWQKTNGLPADGYVEQNLLRRMLAG